MKLLALLCLSPLLFTIPVVCEENIDLKGCWTGNDKLCALCLQKKCTKCWKGLPQSNGLCLAPSPEIANCLEYNPTSKKCSKCVDNYFLKDNVCTKISTTVCLEMDPTNLSKCARCDGLVIENGKCVSDQKCILGCQVCSDMKSCTTCAPNYVLQSGTGGTTTCAVVPEEKQGCLVQNDTCASCLADYYVATLEGETLKCKWVNSVGRLVMGVVVSGLLLMIRV